jgi:hypothetical protein
MMTYRAHPVRFAEIDTGEADEDATGAVAAIGTRRFTVLLSDGTRTSVDLTGWSRPQVAAAFGRVLQEDWRLGGAPSRTAAVKRQMSELRRFFRFLDTQAEPVEVIEAITPAVINRYEVWLERNGGGRIHQRHLLARLIGLLRLIAERNPARLSAATVQRLAYLGHGACGRSQPRDAYGGAVATMLRRAAREPILVAAGRITPDGALPAPLAGIDKSAAQPLFEAVRMAISDSGWIATADPRYSRFYEACHRQHVCTSKLCENLHGSFHLIAADVIAFLVVLSLETGLEIECLKDLKADCLKNPSKGTVEIEYCKRRARGSEWKRLRVRDGGGSTPGGILRLAIRLSARARRHAGTDLLWVYCTLFGLITPKNLRYPTRRFIERHGVVDDKGDALHLTLSRLRKTQKAEWYVKTEGQMERFAVGHTPEIAANHYGDIPALRHVHEQAAADGLRDALDAALKPRLIPPDEEEAIRATPDLSDLPVLPEEVIAFLDGSQDLWLASCTGFYDSPFGTKGKGCPVPFSGCLECRNAVITSRKLPALIAFVDFMIAQRTELMASDWAVKFGRAYKRITEQILPSFPKAVVAAGRVIAASRADILYLPPEAGAR